LTVQVFASVSTKYGLGYILGEFFTNSSGHPARERETSHRAHCLISQLAAAIIGIHSGQLSACCRNQAGANPTTWSYVQRRRRKNLQRN
jgi:hypothetical protein